MKIPSRPVVAGDSLQLGECRLCDKAWRLFKKAKKLMKGAKDSDKPKWRKAGWLRVLAAKALWKDRENHYEKPRRNRLYIRHASQVSILKNPRCWNCDSLFRLTRSQWREDAVCTFCMAPPSWAWVNGESSIEEAIQWGKDHFKEPYMAKGRWRTHYWDKKAKDEKLIAARGKKED